MGWVKVYVSSNAVGVYGDHCHHRHENRQRFVGEWVEFPLATPMSKGDEFNNADGDSPQAFRDWLGPVGDVFVEIETDIGITGYGQANWGTGAIATIIDETLSKLILAEIQPAERNSGR